MRNKIPQMLLIGLILFTMGFIFVNSALPENQSNSISDSTAQTIEAIVSDDGKNETTPFFEYFSDNIRKAAHAIEFFALGAELCLLLVLQRKVTPQRVVHLCSWLLATAVLDESIQMLSDRNARVSDILLDMGGGLLAVALALLLYALVKCCMAHKTRKKETYASEPSGPIQK